MWYGMAVLLLYYRCSMLHKAVSQSRHNHSRMGSTLHSTYLPAIQGKQVCTHDRMKLIPSQAPRLLFAHTSAAYAPLSLPSVAKVAFQRPLCQRNSRINPAVALIQSHLPNAPVQHTARTLNVLCMQQSTHKCTANTVYIRIIDLHACI